MIIGFEAMKTANGPFLRKLDRMIAISSKPKSHIPVHIQDIKYQHGEGVTQLNKAVSALNLAKESTIVPSNPNMDNEVLLTQRRGLRDAVETIRVRNNEKILKEKKRREDELKHFEMPSIFSKGRSYKL